MKDLSLIVDDYYLNIRVGIIFKYHDKVLIEIRKDRVGNSVIPGGRIKIGEDSSNAIVREIKEEMGITLNKEKLVYIKTLENFFIFENRNVHEIFFVYKYFVDEELYEKLNNVKENLDNHITEYIFINYKEFEKYDLLPLKIRDIIKE